MFFYESLGQKSGCALDTEAQYTRQNMVLCKAGKCPCCQEGNLSGNLSTFVDPVKQSPNWNQSFWWTARVPAMLCYSVTEYLDLEEWTRGDFEVRI